MRRVRGGTRVCTDLFQVDRATRRARVKLEKIGRKGIVVGVSEVVVLLAKDELRKEDGSGVSQMRSRK